MLEKLTRLYPTQASRLYASLRTYILPLNILEKFIPKKGIIIDVGCGYGLTSIYFALKNKERTVIGMDLNKKRIRCAKKAAKKIKNISFHSCNLISSKIKKCDAILAIDLLHHLPEKEKTTFLKNCLKKLKTHGTLIIKDIDRKPLLKFCWNYLHDKIMTKGNPLYFKSSKKLKEFLENHGFKIIKHENIKHLLYPHFILVCKPG